MHLNFDRFGAIQAGHASNLSGKFADCGIKIVLHIPECFRFGYAADLSLTGTTERRDYAKTAPWKNGHSRPALKVTTRTQFLGGPCVNWNCCVVKLTKCKRANRAVAAFCFEAMGEMHNYPEYN